MPVLIWFICVIGFVDAFLIKPKINFIRDYVSAWLFKICKKGQLMSIHLKKNDPDHFFK